MSVSPPRYEPVEQNHLSDSHAAAGWVTMSLNESPPKKGMTDRGAAEALPYHPEPSTKHPGPIQRFAKACSGEVSWEW